MLKKAGIVVLGAAAGMGILAPLANAGEAPQPSHSNTGKDAGWGHDRDGGHGKGHGHGKARGGSCDDIAFSGESSGLVNAPNALSNLDISHLNVLASDSSKTHGCDGGAGDKTAFSGKSSGLVNAPNLLANPSISHVNVLASDSSES